VKIYNSINEKIIFLHNRSHCAADGGNPGTEHCNKTIAEKKGWEVIDKEKNHTKSNKSKYKQMIKKHADNADKTDFRRL
jgi:hypothetical protein